MDIWMRILSFIVFILCLSIVVCIHEAGHLVAAKLSGVYCAEFSIGFGPKLYSHKFKHKVKNKDKKNKKDDPLYEDLTGSLDYIEGETAFSIRALPLGGYVSMAGEDGELDANIIVPKERTLEGVNHFKQICIMLAGIAMNFLLAWVLFFCCFAFCFQQRYVYETPAVNVLEKVNNIESLAYKNGLRSGDQILYVNQEYKNLVDVTETSNEITGSINLTFPKVQTEIKTYLSYNGGQSEGDFFQQDKDSLYYNIQDVTSRRYLSDYSEDKIDQYYSDDLAEFKYYRANKNSTRILTIGYIDSNSEKKEVTITTNAEKQELDNKEYYIFEKIGIEPTIENYKVGFKNAFSEASSTFNSMFVNIYVSLGSLFTPQGWNSVGGIISVYKVSAAGFTSGSVGYFIKLWGFISLNLGCFNLLPFPGLDGWQTLLALIETIIRRKIPSKVKNVANTIGLIVMLVLAGLLIIKDIIRPISLLIMI